MQLSCGIYIYQICGSLSRVICWYRIVLRAYLIVDFICCDGIASFLYGGLLWCDYLISRWWPVVMLLPHFSMVACRDVIIPSLCFGLL